MRCNEQPGLLMMHTVFFLEHNRWKSNIWLFDNRVITRIARALQKSKVLTEYLQKLKTTKEKDDFIYEETRRLVGAIFQSITYREWLPLLLGDKLMQEHDLLTQIGDQSEYDPKMDPTCRDEFGTFSYRYSTPQ